MGCLWEPEREAPRTTKGGSPHPFYILSLLRSNHPTVQPR